MSHERYRVSSHRGRFVHHGEANRHDRQTTRYRYSRPFTDRSRRHPAQTINGSSRVRCGGDRAARGEGAGAGRRDRYRHTSGMSDRARLLFWRFALYGAAVVLLAGVGRR